MSTGRTGTSSGTSPSIGGLVLTYGGTLDPPATVFRFDGSTYIENSVVNFPTDAVTIECWLRTTQTTAGAVILCYDNATADAARRLWIKSPGNLQVGFGANASPSTGVSVADGAWHHFAAMIAPSTSTALAVGIWIDGYQRWFGNVALSRTAGAWPVTGQDMRLGGSGLPGETGFVGDMSEFRMWDSVLDSATEMLLMRERAIAGTSGLSLLWALDTSLSTETISGTTQFVPSNPPLAFYEAGNRTLQASWTATPTATPAALQLSSSDNRYFAPASVAGTSYSLPVPAINVIYAASIAAYDGTSIGTYSPAVSVAAIDLAAPAPTLAYSLSSVQLSWSPIDQAASYAVAVNVGGTPSATTVSGTSFDLTTLVAGTSTVIYSVAGLAISAGSSSVNVFGPASPAPTSAPAAPTVTLAYHEPTGAPGTLKVDLSGVATSSPAWLTVSQASTAVLSTMLPAGTTHLDLTSIAPSFGKTYTAAARAMPPGAVGAWSPAATVACIDIAGPHIVSMTGDTVAQTLAMTWTPANGTPAGATFVAQVVTGATTLTPYVGTLTSATFPSTLVTTGATFSGLVRAVSGGVYGRWSQPFPLTVGGLPQVSGLSALTTQGGDLSVNWPTIAATVPVTYSVAVSGGASPYTTTTTDSSTNILKTNSGLSCGTVYTITVTATSPSAPSGPASKPAIVTLCVSPLPPSSQSTVSDPVQVVSGAFSYPLPLLNLSSVVPILFQANYNSNAATATGVLAPSLPLGPRWNHSLNSRVSRDPSSQNVYMVLGDQNSQTFLMPTSGSGPLTSSGAPPGTGLALQPNGQYLYTRPDGAQTIFDSSGKPVTMIDRYGNSATLAYSGTLLSSVTDLGTNRQISLGYTSLGSLSSVSDGSAVPAAYSRTVSFGYDGSGNLQTIVDPLGNTQTITCTTGGLITSIVDWHGVTAVSNTYNSSGQVTLQADGRQSTSALSYASQTLASGIPIVVTTGTDRMGNSLAYSSFQGTGGSYIETLALDSQNARVVNRAFDANNQITSETVFVGAAGAYSSGLGNTTAYQYDGNGHQTLAITLLYNGAARVVSRGFDTAGNLLTEAVYEGPYTVSAPSWGLGNVASYSYNSDNSVRQAIDPLGRTQTVSYASGTIHGLPISSVDVLGNTTSYAYSGADLTQQIDPIGRTTTFGRDPLGRISGKTITSSAGATLAVRSYTYDRLSRLTTATAIFDNQPVSQAFTTTFQYDANGNRTSAVNCLGNTIAWHYTPNNSLDTLTFPADSDATRQLIYAYDSNDFVSAATLTSSVAGAGGVVANYTNDALGRTVRAVDPNGNTYSYGYAMTATSASPCYAVARTTWPTLAGSTTTFGDSTLYDPLGRPIQAIDRSNQTTTLSYGTTTSGGRYCSVVTTVFPAATAGTTATTYAQTLDPVGRPLAVVDQDGHTTAYSYGTATISGGSIGEAVTIVDSSGHQTVVVYDAGGRLVSEIEGTGATTHSYQYTYDALDRLVSVVDGAGTLATTVTYAHGYDTLTNLITESIGRPGSTTGATVRYFDGLMNAVREVDPFGGTQAWTYSPSGLLTAYVNARAQTMTYGFDGTGSYTSSVRADGTTLTHTLDRNGNRTATTIGGGPSISRGFDAWNRLTSRVGVEGATILSAYTPTDRLATLTYSDGKQVVYGNDNLGRLTSVVDWAARTTSYTYSNAGMVKRVVHANGTTSSYDKSGPTIGITHASGNWTIAQASVTLDALRQPATGNVIQPTKPAYAQPARTMTYGTGNQLATFDGTTVSLDGSGNLTSAVGSTTGTIAYDAFGRVTQAPMSGGATASFVYDPDGLRTAATLAGAVSNNVYDVSGFLAPAVERADGWRALQGTDPGRDPFRARTGWPIFAGSARPVPVQEAVDRLLELRDGAQTVQIRFVHGIGLIAQEDANGHYRVFHDDLAGNTWLLTDTSGAITDINAFDPFGSALTPPGPTATPFLFGGRWGAITDPGTGLIHMRARSFAPAPARFLQPDILIGDPWRPQSLNRYAYVSGNPVMQLDPLGLAKVAGIVVGVVVPLALIGGAAILARMLGGGGGGGGGRGSGRSRSSGRRGGRSSRADRESDGSDADNMELTRQGPSRGAADVQPGSGEGETDQLVVRETNIDRPGANEGLRRTAAGRRNLLGMGPE